MQGAIALAREDVDRQMASHELDSRLRGNRDQKLVARGSPTWRYFIATASVVVGKPTLWQNAAKRGSSR